MTIKTKQNTEIFWSIFLCFSFIQNETRAQNSCEQDLPMPFNAIDNRDTSGLRPTRQPPIPVGDSLSYQCPGMKSIKGKSSFIVKCNDLKQYVFPEDLASWGECQCSDTMAGDLTAQCPGLTYDINYRYVYRRSDKPSMKLTIPQPSGTTHWKLGLQMDQNVEKLHVRTSDASMTRLNKDTVLLEPLAKNDFNSPNINITIEYFFDDIEDIEANNLGEIPRWRHPCIKLVTTCEYKDNLEAGRGTILGVIGLILFFVILLILCCACCNYCILKSAANRTKQDMAHITGRTSVSTIDGDWYRPIGKDISPRRRTTPRLEEYNFRSITPSPQPQR